MIFVIGFWQESHTSVPSRITRLPSGVITPAAYKMGTLARRRSAAPTGRSLQRPGRAPSEDTVLRRDEP